jgi:hypothetical protein
MTPAGEHRRLADLLEATADEVRPLGAALAAFHRPDVWSGQRADRFGRELDDRRRQLRLTADELCRQAAELRAWAQRQEQFRGTAAAG